MIFKKLDLWLRDAWAFWDTHGTRILGIVGFLYSAISGVAVALAEKIDKSTMVTLLAIAAVLGAMVHARGTTNAQPPPTP